MSFIAGILEQSHDASVTTDGIPVLTYAEQWRLKDNSGTWVGSHQARLNFTTATGIAPGAPYADYQFATCRRIRVKRQRTRVPFQAWTIDVEWSTETQKMDDPNPANRRWIREVSDSDQQRFIIRDRNNKLIVDTAGTPFDGGVPINVKLTTYNWEHNVDWSNYNLNSIGEYSGKINSDTFLGKPPGTLMLAYRAKENWEGIYHFATEFYTIIYDPQGWKPKPANAGLYYIDDTVNPKKRTRIKVDGKDAIEPEPLDKNGAMIDYTRRPQDCIFVEVDYYNPIPFSSLNLPVQ